MYAILFINKCIKLLKNIMSKNTLNGTRKKVIKTSGFRARLATKNGKKILKNRRRKGRWNLAMKK